MLRLKPQTAYNYDYHETLFLMAIIIARTYVPTSARPTPQMTIISVK